MVKFIFIVSLCFMTGISFGQTAPTLNTEAEVWSWLSGHTFKASIEGDFDMKGKRFAFYNDQFYFKTTEEMTKLWSHVPEAIDNTNEIVGKVETLKLTKDVLLPNFQIPSTCLSQDDYLEHITMEGAKKRYIDIDQVVEERLRFELHTIRTMGLLVIS